MTETSTSAICERVLSINQAEESSKTFQKLRYRRSAVESHINHLEHYGLDRYLDKGLHAFKRYCAPEVLAANLHKLILMKTGTGERASGEDTKKHLYFSLIK